MNVFEDVKTYISARQVAEYYGLKVGRNGMACCPFHNDKHPSMKIDKTHYHCFGCGAHGDAIGFVAQSFGLSQIEAANKIIEDFRLPIETDHKLSNEDRKEFARIQAENRYKEKVKQKFNLWVNETIELLKESEEIIESAREYFIDKNPGAVFISNGFAYLLHKEPIVGYWLDILCMGSEEEKREFFLTDGKEVTRIAANIKRAGEEILGRTGKRAG